MLCGCGGRSVTSVAFVSIDARCILGQSVVFAHTYVWQMQRIGGRAVLVCNYCAGLHIVKTINPLSSLVFGHNSCLCHPQSQFLPLSTHVLQNYGVCGVLWSWVLFALLGCFCEIAPACFFQGVVVCVVMVLLQVWCVCVYHSTHTCVLRKQRIRG